MTPEQLQSLANLITQELKLSSWWQYGLMLLAALIGSFAGPYIRRRAETSAVSADFETLTRQLKATTEAAESVKQTLAGRGWLKQQQWVLRERHYMDLLQQLTLFMLSNQHLRDLSMRRWEFDTSPESEWKLEAVEKGLVEERSASLKAIKLQIGMAAVFLSPSSTEAIKVLLGHSIVIQNNASDFADHYSMWAAAASEAYDKVLAEARRDLEAADHGSME